MASLKTLVPVRPRTEESRRVEYLLKLSIRTQDVHGVTAWHFSNARRAAAFEDAVKGLKVLHAWVDPHELDASNSLEALAERGFAFGRGGMRFDTGTTAPSAVARRMAATTASSETPKRLILCQIGVGKSFVVDDPDAVATLTAAPEGYDSVFLARPSRLPGGELNPDVYRHEYVMFHATRALPMYLVQYYDGPAPPEGTRVGPAALLDVNQTLAAPHGLPNDAVQALYDRYDFFDPILYIPVSVRDKMVGSHSTGDAAQHKLIGIGDAYDAAVAESLKPDPLLAERQAELRLNLRAVDAKLQEVNRNSAEVEEKIYKALQDALFELQDATQKRMSALLAEEVELRRQLQHIDWIESFLDRQREEASPVDFLNAWKCHVQLRGDVCRAPIETAGVLGSVTADLDLVGGVRVVSRGTTTEAERTTYAAPPAVVSAAGRYPVGVPPSLLGGAGANARMAPSNNTGGGAMIIEGSPSSPPAPGAQRTQAGNVSGLATDLDVSRAWGEALREQAAEQARRAGQLQLNDATGGGRGLFEEVPPTPPSLPAKAKAKGSSVTPERFAVFSLSADAVRRLRKSQNKKLIDPATCFPNSMLISDKPVGGGGAAQDEAKTGEPNANANASPTDDSVLSEAQALYLSLPQPGVGRLPPQVKLLYATWSNQDERTIAALLRAMPKEVVRNPDGTETEFVLTCPTVLVVAANGRRFGGFASGTWRADGKAFGDAKSFLFSLDKDVKIPFHGREVVDGPAADGARFPSLASDETAFKFGNGDLVFANDFLSCSTELEHSFGVGMLPGSEECRTFLAGTERFQCDAWELWAVMY